MSKIGQYVLHQIELGNYTVDRRDKINVCLHHREERSVPAGKDTGDSIRQDGGRRQHSNKTGQSP